MSIPKVSVLTTVYNREKYLGACIESVLASSFENWELIIVDDQSSDASVDIAKQFEKRDVRIKVIINDKNLGDYPNRNKAASFAKGKYLKYLDADDLIYPHGLEVMVKTMEDFPEANLGVSQEVAEDFQPFPFLMTPREAFKREFLQRGVLRFGPTATIIRRKAFESHKGFTGTRFIGDTEMWYKLAMYDPVVKMVPGLTFWRQHEDQEITKGIENFFYLENTYKHQVQTLRHDDLPLTELDRQVALKRANKRFSRNILRLVKAGRYSTANEIRMKCGVSWSVILKSL